MEASEAAATKLVERRIRQFGELIAEKVDDWDYYSSRVGRKLDAEMIADAWIRAFAKAGIAGAGHPSTWIRKANGTMYPKPLHPFVIEFDCPYGHRTEDRMNRAKVWLIMEDNGWPTLADASPCKECTQDALEWWLLACPRCQVGEISDRHDRDLFPSELNPAPGELGGCIEPAEVVLRELMQLAEFAEAHWWVDRKDQAVAEWDAALARWKLEDPEREHTPAEYFVARSLKVLESEPKTKSKASPKALTAVKVVEDWSDNAKVIKWLEDNGVPATATTRDAWELVKVIEPRPPKGRCDAVQPTRKPV